MLFGDHGFHLRTPIFWVGAEIAFTEMALPGLFMRLPKTMEDGYKDIEDTLIIN